MAAAEAFLSAHQGQVAFVTIDIGGDDITGRRRSQSPSSLS